MHMSQASRPTVSDQVTSTGLISSRREAIDRELTRCVRPFMDGGSSTQRLCLLRWVWDSASTVLRSSCTPFVTRGDGRYPLVSTAVTAHFLIGSIVTANLPALHQRFGVPVVTKAGALLLAVGVFGWAIAAAPWQLFAATLLSGAGWVTMGIAAVNAIVSPWFARDRPAALAAAYNGANVGGIIFSPLWAAAIGVLGFPIAAAAIGLVMVLVMWVLADRVFARTPNQVGLNPDGDGPGALVSSASSPTAKPLPGSLLWRDRKFIALSAGTSFGLFAQIGLTAHLFSLLLPALGAQQAGLAMGAVTVMAIAGRTLVGSSWVRNDSAWIWQYFRLYNRNLIRRPTKDLWPANPSARRPGRTVVAQRREVSYALRFKRPRRMPASSGRWPKRCVARPKRPRRFDPRSSKP